MQDILSILPLLACPLMMGVMMWVMMRGTSRNQGQDHIAPMARLGREPGEVAFSATPRERTPDEQVAELRTRLARLQSQQQAIAGHLAKLDAPEELSRNV